MYASASFTPKASARRALRCSRWQAALQAIGGAGAPSSTTWWLDRWPQGHRTVTRTNGLGWLRTNGNVPRQPRANRSEFHVSRASLQSTACQACTKLEIYPRAGMPAYCGSRGVLRCGFLLLLPGLHCLAAGVPSILELVGEELPCQRMLLALCVRPPWLAAVSVAAAHAGVSCGGKMLCNRRRRHATAWLPAQAWKLLLSLRRL